MKVALREINYRVIEINDDQLMTQKEAAVLLNISIAAVRNRMNQGNLPTVEVPPSNRRYTLKDAVMKLVMERN